MLNVGPLEIITILVIGLVVFGPTRLPDMMRKAGRFVANLRRMTAEMTREWKEPLDEIRKPLEEIRKEGQALRREITGAMGEVQANVNTTASGIKDAVAAPGRDLKAELDQARRALEGSSETRSGADDL